MGPLSPWLPHQNTITWGFPASSTPSPPPTIVPQPQHTKVPCTPHHTPAQHTKAPHPTTGSPCHVTPSFPYGTQGPRPPQPARRTLTTQPPATDEYHYPPSSKYWDCPGDSTCPGVFARPDASACPGALARMPTQFGKANSLIFPW